MRTYNFRAEKTATVMDECEILGEISYEDVCEAAAKASRLSEEINTEYETKVKTKYPD